MSEPVQPGTENATAQEAGGGQSIVATAAAPLPGEEGFKVTLNKNAAKRANASVMGMIIALLVSIACILPVILLNANPKDEGYHPNVDVPAVAANAAGPAGFVPIVVDTPSGWNAQYARFSQGEADGVPTWEVGYLAPSQSFVALTQTNKANKTWINQELSAAPVTGTRNVGGQNWELRDNGKGIKSLVLEDKGTTVLLSGRGKLEDFDVIATSVVAQLQKISAAGGAATQQPVSPATK